MTEQELETRIRSLEAAFRMLLSRADPAPLAPPQPKTEPAVAKDAFRVLTTEQMHIINLEKSNTHLLGELLQLRYVWDKVQRDIALKLGIRIRLLEFEILKLKSRKRTKRATRKVK
jgi:hypothetical protein